MLGNLDNWIVPPDELAVFFREAEAGGSAAQKLRYWLSLSWVFCCTEAQIVAHIELGFCCSSCSGVFCMGWSSCGTGLMSSVQVYLTPAFCLLQQLGFPKVHAIAVASVRPLEYSHAFSYMCAHTQTNTNAYTNSLKTHKLTDACTETNKKNTHTHAHVHTYSQGPTHTGNVLSL